MTSLQVRVPLLGAIVLALSLAVAGVLAFALIMLTGRNNLEITLAREQRRVERALPLLVEEVGGQGSTLSAKALRAAAERYFRTTPGTDAYLTIVRIGDRVFAADDAPDAIERLRDLNAIPRNAAPGLETFDTSLGEILSLLSVLSVADGPPASLQIVAPTEPIRTEAFRALRWLGVASVASLVVVGALLALVLRRSLAPLRSLASLARRAELEDLSLRVPEPPRMDEVGILTREINRMLARLEEAAESQREFMATVSHELRTPVTIASGHVQVLESMTETDPEERAQAVALVRGELVRMQRLVDDLMTVARSRAEGFLVTRPAGLPAFFDELRLRLTGLGTRPVEVGPAPEVTLEADQERLAQAVLNLVINADVHTPPGTPIEIGAYDDGRWASIFVRDQGPGIDPAIRASMFEPFVRGGDATGSSGLGLAVVSAVVDAHDGTIDVDTGGEGTSLTLHIPLASASDEVVVRRRTSL